MHLYYGVQRPLT